MNFFKKLFRGEDLSIQDDFFGRLTAKNVKKNAVNVDWSTEFPINKTDKLFIHFTGSALGVSVVAKKRLKQLFEEYNTMIFPKIKEICAEKHALNIDNFIPSTVFTFDAEALETIFIFNHKQMKEKTVGVTLYFDENEQYFVEVREENVHV